MTDAKKAADKMADAALEEAGLLKKKPPVTDYYGGGYYGGGYDRSYTGRGVGVSEPHRRRGFVSKYDDPLYDPFDDEEFGRRSTVAPDRSATHLKDTDHLKANADGRHEQYLASTAWTREKQPWCKDSAVRSLIQQALKVEAKAGASHADYPDEVYREMVNIIAADMGNLIEAGMFVWTSPMLVELKQFLNGWLRRCVSYNGHMHRTVTVTGEAKRHELYCKDCGGSTISATAPVLWNHGKQDWEREDEPEGLFCDDCGGVNIVEMEAKGPVYTESAEDQLRYRVTELQQTFDLIWSAQEKVDQMWRDAHPDEAPHLPDNAIMMLWLLGENRALRAKLEGK